MEVGNITKAATCKLPTFHLSYKTTQLLFCDSAFYYFHETGINRLFFRVRQKYELRASFKVTKGVNKYLVVNKPFLFPEFKYHIALELAL